MTTPTATAIPWPTRTPQRPVTRAPQATVATRVPISPPTPGPSPTPFFPPQAAVPSSWPALPSDLYFLRGGQLWHWDSAGGEPERLAPRPGATEQVVHYRLTPDGGTVAYQTRAGQLYVLDRASGSHQLLPTVGQLSLISQEGAPLAPDGHAVGGDVLDITPDGRIVLYMAWGVQPGAQRAGPGRSEPLRSRQQQAPAYGTIYAVEVAPPNRPYELGFCQPGLVGENELQSSCQGFLLSPDGSQLVYSNVDGIWAVQIPTGQPRLLTSHPEGFCGILYPQQWSPDGQGLLIGMGCYEGSQLVVLRIPGSTVRPIPSSWCYVACYSLAAWGPEGIWLSTGTLEWGEEQPAWEGSLRLVHLATDGTIQVTRQLSETAAGRLLPGSLFPLSDGRLAFAQEACPGSGGLQAGLYILSPDNSLDRLALLPSSTCCTSTPYAPQFCPGAARWDREGEAFLYSDSGGVPLLLGLMDGSALWDVRELLRGAGQFAWGE